MSAPVGAGQQAATQAASSERLFSAVIIAVGTVTAALLLWTRRAYVPMWDGRIYADCVVDAAANLLEPAGYRCAGHISQSYVAILVMFQRLAPDSASLAPILAANTALLAIAAVALSRLLRVVFPDPSHMIGRALVVACFLVHPVVLGSAVQPGLDFGVLVFSLCALAAAVEGRRWTFVGVGLFLVFSKEPGLPVYGVIAAAYLWQHGLLQIIPGGARWLAVVVIGLGTIVNATTGNFLSATLFAVMLLAVDWRALRPARPPLRAVMRVLVGHWPLALPVLFVGGYLGSNLLLNAINPARSAEPGAQAVWGNTGAGALVKTVLRPGVMDQQTLVALAMIFILGFLWLPTLVTLLDLLIGVVRRRGRQAARHMAGVDTATLGIIAAVVIGELWFLSRFRTVANARYYLPLYPLLLMLAYGALVRLGVSRHYRTAAFALLAVLLGVSTVRTVDPVSRALWGTFKVGDHAMLRMTSLTGECCGFGRDQLVYNLQFTAFDALQNAAYASIRPSDSTALVMPIFADWFTVGPLDADTRRRTMRRERVVTPPILNSVHAFRVPRLPASWYVEMPYMDNAEALFHLAKVYALGAPRRIEVDGYSMNVRTMRLRPPPLDRQASDPGTDTTPARRVPR